MSEVEILLSVDAGKSPPDTVTIFMDDRDPDARQLWRRLFLYCLAAVLVLSGLALAYFWGRPALGVTTLLLLGAGAALLRATPTIAEVDPTPRKRQVMVVTTTGVIVRGDWGVKTWRFEDLADIVAGVDAERRPMLELRDRDGTRYRLRCSGFRCWMRAQQAVTPHLVPPEPYRRSAPA